MALVSAMLEAATIDSTPLKSALVWWCGNNVPPCSKFGIERSEMSEDDLYDTFIWREKNLEGENVTHQKVRSSSASVFICFRSLFALLAMHEAT